MSRSEDPPRRRRRERRPSSPRRKHAVQQARIAALEAAAFKEMVRENWAIPAMGLAAVLLLGATRFAETRAGLATVVALGAPLAALLLAVAPLREAHPTFRAVSLVVAAAIALGAESLIAPVVLASGAPPALAELGSLPWLPAALIAAALLTVPLEAIAVKRGVGSRFAALAGIAVGMALYLPAAKLDPSDPLGGTLVAFLIAFFVGGGLGLLLGAIARGWSGSRV